MLKNATIAALAAIFLIPAVATAADPEVKCQAGKLMESSKYAACRLKVESKAVLKDLDADYAKCDAKLTDKWAKIETKAKGACVDAILDTEMQGFLTANSDAVAEALDGGTLPSLACGNGILDPGEDCDFGTLGGADCDLATGGAQMLGNLTCGPGCVFNTSGCSTVRFEPRNVEGETTVVDHQTGLEWVVQDDRNVQSVTWSNTGTLADGSVFYAYLADLNTASHAGHDDWRLPAIEELESIVDPAKGSCGGASGACIDQSLFGYTVGDFVYSITEDPSDALYAQVVDFGSGTTQTYLKMPPFGFIRARAVRSAF